MSKGLEALEVAKQLKEFVLEFVKNGLDRRFIHGSFDIIETALRDYEKKTKLAKEYKDVNNVAKRLKALEIIKSFCKFDIYEYKGEYFMWIILSSTSNAMFRLKNKEEYDLLKEVLL